MTVYFDLAIIPDCVLQIQDTTLQFPATYLPEDSNKYITPGRFKYTDTYTVNVIRYIPSCGNSELLETIITPHVSENTPMFCDEACFTLPKDGHYVIEHMIIPSKDCVDLHVINSDYDYIYATDGSNFYEKVEDTWVICDISNILEVSSDSVTTVSKAVLDTFSLCLLNKRYLELCKDHLCKLMNNHCLSSSEAHDFDLDLIWMSINAIKYNIEFGMLLLALSLLEEINKCTGISKLQGTALNKNISHGCKCCI